VSTRGDPAQRWGLDPRRAGAQLALDAGVLARSPEGDRHLAYPETKLGLTIKLDLAPREGVVVSDPHAYGRVWLVARRRRSLRASQSSSEARSGQ
jgi:hypothetical protein